MLAINFHGAARTTTGSMHLVEANGLRILLDCGLFQGHRKEAFERNRNLPFDATTLDCVVLSHAHIDHSGNLPTLVRRGYQGPVICTPATAALCDVMLYDSAYLQSQDLAFVNKKRKAQGKNLFEPLYEEAEVARLSKLMRPTHLQQTVDLGQGVSVTLNEAGHILGSATIQLDVRNRAGQTHRLLFSGDLGNDHQPLIRKPVTVPDVNTLLIESTYADREHPHIDNVLGRLKGFIEDIHHQKAKLIIPAFSVGRTQNILYYLNQLVAAKRIPPTPVYVDSPLAIRATAVYRQHPECYDADARAILNSGRNPLDFPGLHFTLSVAESMALNTTPGPMIIIAASGMAEGGRIVHHLRNSIIDPRNIVLIVGYQAEHTLGRRIVNREPTVSIFGQPVPLNARVHTVNALSAHADRTGLMRWFDELQTPALRNAFALHGDEAQTGAMVALLQERHVPQALAPVAGQRLLLEP